MFGMGTGGSLRLLSPEIQGCSRTLKTAQVFVYLGSAPLRPTKALLSFTAHSFTNHLLGLRFSFSGLSFALRSSNP